MNSANNTADRNSASQNSVTKNWVLYTADNDESRKILSIVELFALDIRIEPVTTQISQSSTYGAAPILQKEEQLIDCFWNIILTFDHELWDSQLLLSDPSALNQLFSAVETCDQYFIPAVVFANMPEENMDSSSRFTQLLQWVFLSADRKKRTTENAKRQNLQIERSTPNTARVMLQSFIKDQQDLPVLHFKILNGLAGSFLEPA